VVIVNAVTQVLANSSGETIGPITGALVILWFLIVVALFIAESRRSPAMRVPS
jgi:hypothetical protein